jgi:transketolase|tara:strand:+ start:458 stop:1447 length:990 start_codon:yes stop_codon:yes gene_type:complete
MNELLNMSEADLAALPKKDTRSGFGQGLLELGSTHPNVVAMCADLTGSLKMNAFQDAFPDRFYQAGIMEANMISVASGLTIGGKIPFTGTFANFSTGRVYDQIRQSVCYSDKNVKICASHCGVTLGEDGATHQILEDLGMMKMLPGMTVIHTCDYEQTRQATKAVADHVGPVYLRFGRPKMPMFTPVDTPFVIGKADQLMTGEHVTVIATGHLVWEAVLAARILAKDGITVDLINMHTIKPMDIKAVLDSARKTGAVVTAEEHQRAGGLGESVAQVLCEHLPTPLRMVAVNDSFGESGTPAQLLAKYNLDAAAIVRQCEAVLSLKEARV